MQTADEKRGEIVAIVVSTRTCELHLPVSEASWRGKT